MSDKIGTRTQILEQLKARPHTTGELAKALKLDPSTVAYHLKPLAAAGKIKHEGNQRSPWILAGAVPASEPPAPAPRGAGRAATKRKVRKVRRARKAKAVAKKGANRRNAKPTRFVHATGDANPLKRLAGRRFKVVPAGRGALDLEVKQRVLEGLAEDAPPLLAFALREIREDLQRLAA